MMHNVLVIIQCRYNSRRLPGKALLPLAGTTMLSFLIRRLQWGLEDTGWKIVLATTERRDDDPVARTGQKQGLDVVRGAVDDVLSRFALCMDSCPDTKALVRVTADNPLTCPAAIRETVQALLQNKADYSLCQEFPIGTTADVFSAETFQILIKNASLPQEREHINKYILDREQEFDVVRIQADEALKRPDLSLTVDTDNDWQRVSALFTNTESRPWEINLDEAITRMDKLSFR